MLTAVIIQGQVVEPSLGPDSDSSDERAMVVSLLLGVPVMWIDSTEKLETSLAVRKSV
jgi:hypothetical protein